MTEWRDIPGYPGYQISDDGKCRRVVPNGRNWPPQELKANLDLKGYRSFEIGTKEIKKRHKASRLVLFAFVGPPPAPNYHAAHNDGSKDNDSLSNLRWATPKENQADRKLHGTALIGEKNHATKLSAEDIERIKEAYRASPSRKIRADLARTYGVDKSRIWQLTSHYAS